jgi:hypothetical protein
MFKIGSKIPKMAQSEVNQGFPARSLSITGGRENKNILGILKAV